MPRVRSSGQTTAPSSPRDELPPSFDHLVGEDEQSRRHGEAQRFRGLEVHDHFVFRRELSG